MCKYMATFFALQGLIAKGHPGTPQEVMAEARKYGDAALAEFTNEVQS